MTNKISITTRYKEEIVNKTKFIAMKENRSWNNLIELAVEKFVKEWENQNGTIQNSDLADLD